MAELQLKIQPTTPPDIREQCEAAINEDMTTLEAVVKDYIQLFEQIMEMRTSL